MNKRLIKKMLKRREQFNGFLFAEGNNGGDFIKIQNEEEGSINLEVGSCCVMIIDKVVPVEFLTGIIQNAMFENNFDINKIIDSFRWEQNFKDELKEKVRKAY
jgi:hypothetical protein